MRRALLVMAKRPFPGQTKTRLTPFFSVEAAAELYASFLQDVLALVRQVPGVTPFVAYAPVAGETPALSTAEAAVYFRELAPDFELIAQVGETLGDRLDTVLSGCLASGFDQVAAINSDSPTLPVDYLIDAFARLDEPETDVVLGPCEDGGYYLIGWKRPLRPGSVQAYSRLVREVEMSTTHVLADTLAIAAADNLRVSLLPSWYDVDEVTELKRLRHALLTGKEQALHSARFFERWNNNESTYTK